MQSPIKCQVTIDTYFKWIGRCQSSATMAPAQAQVVNQWEQWPWELVTFMDEQYIMKTHQELTLFVFR